MGRPRGRPRREHGGRDPLQAAEQPPGAAEQDRGPPGRRHGRAAHPQGGRRDHRQRGQVGCLGVRARGGPGRGEGATTSRGGRGSAFPSCGHLGSSGHPSLPRPCSPPRSGCCQEVLSRSSSLGPLPRRAPLVPGNPKPAPSARTFLQRSFNPGPGSTAPPLSWDPDPPRTLPSRDPVLQRPYSH